MSRILQIHPDDNVAVALEPLKAGEVVETSAGAVTLREDIPQGHKLALMDIPSEAAVVKYGFPIGHATQAIHVGDWVHSHDLATSLNEEAVTAAAITPVQEAPAAARTFRGFRRKGGVGIRNEIWIIPTVGCVNSVAETLARIVSHDIRGSVTGVYAWPHPYGCSQTGDDQEHTRRILCDLICHPNAGGVLVLGLGCENSNIGELKKLLGDWDPERIAFLECQSVPDELEAGKVLLRRLIGHAAKDVRCSIPVSELVVGLKRLRPSGGHHRQSAGGPHCRPAGGHGRYGSAGGGAGDVRRRGGAVPPLCRRNSTKGTAGIGGGFQGLLRPPRAGGV